MHLGQTKKTVMIVEPVDLRVPALDDAPVEPIVEPEVPVKPLVPAAAVSVDA